MPLGNDRNGNDRGRAAPEAAAAIFRIDAELGRPADINEAWRSPEQANANRARWLAYERYLNGGPWAPKAPYALGAEDSVHCDGYAADSDDWYDPAAAAVWRRNGFRQTARYPGTARDEPWHGEYNRRDDENYGRPAGVGATPIRREWDEMATPEQIRAETKQALRELLNEAGENAPQAVQNITFLAEQANGWIDDKRPREGQLALAISRVTEILHAVDGVADPRIIGADGKPVVRALAAFLRSRPDAPSSGVVDVDEQAIVAGVLAGLAQNQQLLLDAIDALPAETIAALRTALGSAA